MQVIVRKAIILLVAMIGSATARAAEEQPPPPMPSPSALSEAESATYLIGPGDVLEIFVWRNPELSSKVPVRPDGRISTPLVEDILVVGKTPPELAREIERQLAVYVRTPQVNVIVVEPVSVNSQVTVIGPGVTNPQTVPYRQGMKVLDAVLAAGGLSDFAAGNRARVVRTDDNGRETELRVKLADLMNKGRTKENIELRPGDMIVVPGSRW